MLLFLVVFVNFSFFLKNYNLIERVKLLIGHFLNVVYILNEMTNKINFVFIGNIFFWNQAQITLDAEKRGDIRIVLVSPSGTKSILLTPRIRDNSNEGFQDWPFMTVHCWGEKPFGVWKLEIYNQGKLSGKYCSH